MKYTANIILLAFRGSPLPAARVEVEAEDPIRALDEVFSLAQNVDDSWINDSRVQAVFAEGTTEEVDRSSLTHGARSLSVGDRVELVGIGTWECQSFGWERIPS